MAFLIVYQLNAAVQPMELQQLRRKLHNYQPFRICGRGSQGECLELPGNAVIYDGPDVDSAETVFKEFLRSESLLSSLEQTLYLPLPIEAKLESVRICSNGKCSSPTETTEASSAAQASGPIDQKRAPDEAMVRSSADTTS